MTSAATWMSRPFILLVAAFVLLHGGAITAAHAAGPDLMAASAGLWRDVAERDVQPARRALGRARALPAGGARPQRAAEPSPSTRRMEGTEAARTSPAVIALPMPDGSVARFAIAETQVMAPELAAKFPEIRTWAGQGLDDPAATVRLDWTPQGFHAMILSAAAGRVFIDPYSRDDTLLYISYFTRDHLSPGRGGFYELPPIDAGGRMTAHIQSLMAARRRRPRRARSCARTGSRSPRRGSTRRSTAAPFPSGRPPS